jgi:hypothetical protein
MLKKHLLFRQERILISVSHPAKCDDQSGTESPISVPST